MLFNSNYRITRFLCFSLLFFTWEFLPAQNLVPNPSFETYTGQMCGWITAPASFPFYAANWMIPTNGTSDIHSTLTGIGCWNFQPNSMYSGCWPGSQMPRTGTQMAGIYTYASGSVNAWREYLEVRLTTPLTVGERYVVEYYASLADFSSYATNNLGFHLSTNQINMPISWALPITPTYNNTAVLNNAIAWTRISDTILATQAFEYLTIGNFFDSPLTTIQNRPGCLPGYYFIDDVSVYHLDSVLNDTTICLGDSVELCVQQDTSIWWTELNTPNDTIDTTACITVAPFITTTYVVHKPSGNDTATVFVVLPPPPPTLPPDTTLCGGPILLSAGGPPGQTYGWLPGGSTSMDILVTTAGQYIVTVSNGCFSLMDTVFVFPTPVVDLGPDTTMCQGDSLFLSTQFPLLPTLWSTGQVGNSIYAHPPGLTWVEISHPHCGPVRDSIVLNEIIPPTLAAMADTFVCAFPVTRSAPFVSGLSYLWNTGDTTVSVNLPSAGTYSYQATHVCSTYQDTFTVSYAPPVSVNLGADTSICQGATLLLNAGNSGSTYLWSDNSAGQTLAVNAAGSYHVQVTGPCSSGSDTIQVNIIVPPPAVSIEDTSICPGGSATFSIGPQSNTITWSNNSSVSSISLSSPGLVWVSLSNACFQTADSATLTVLPLVSANLPADTTLCPGDQYMLNAGAQPGSLLWSDNSTGQTFNITSPGTYGLTVTGPCNVSSDVIVVNVGLMPSVTLGNDTMLCGEKGFTIFAQYSGDNFFWQDNSGDPSYNVSSTGWYYATATTQCGTASDSIYVALESYPFIDLGPDLSGCDGSSFSLNPLIPTGMNLTWENASSQVPRIVSQSGTYSAVMNNVCGNAYDSVTVTIYPLPVVNIGNDTSICDGDNVILDAGPGYAAYLWNNNATSQTLTISNAGNWIVTVTDANGCSDSDTMVLDIMTCNPFVPSAFSPNGDGRNDNFFPMAMPERVVNWEVLDRWGKLIYTTDSPSGSWDGTFNGSPCPEGVYIWRGTFKNGKGGESKEAGTVTLMR